MHFLDLQGLYVFWTAGVTTEECSTLGVIHCMEHTVEAAIKCIQT